MRLFITLLLGLAVNVLPGQVYPMANATVTTCGGTFYDSGGGAGNYANNQNLTMTFTPSAAGSAMQVAFSAMDIQADYDLLYVYDGNSTAAPLIGIFCGTTLPGTVAASNINPTGSLTFRFTSNGFTNRPGWAATLSCVAPGTPAFAMQNGTFTTCNARFYDTGGPNQVYHWGESGEITFCPAAAGSCISISFNPIALELDYDYLYVYDGSSSSAPLIAKFGDNAAAQVFTASAANASGCLTVRFTTDGWDNRAGWDATVSCVPCIPTPYYAIDAVTNSSITSCSFYLTDNGGAAGDYLDNSAEFIKICSNSGPNPYVNLSFTQFNTEAGFDVLSIYDGPSALYPLIGSYSGTTIPALISSSDPSGCLYLAFTSDGGVAKPGFLALVSCSPVAALPIELVSFTGNCADGEVALGWTTATETNNDFFTVERTPDGVTWEVIGTVDGAGTSTGMRQYHFTDRSPSEGTMYYRLKQTDYDGQFSHSGIIAVSNCISHGNTRVWPNPSAGQFTLEAGGVVTDSLNVNISDCLGRMLSGKVFTGGETRIALDYSQLPDGVYFLEVFDRAGYIHEIRRVVIER